MNPFIVVPLIRMILANDPTIIEPIVDRLVSILICLNCLFIGNYKLKDQTWELIVSILERVRSRIGDIPEPILSNLLKLKVLDYLFKDFDDQRHYEKEEVESAKRALKDSNSA